MPSSKPATPFCQKDAAASKQTSVDRRHCTIQLPARQGIVLHALPVHLHLARVLAKARRQGHDRCRSVEEELGPQANRKEAYGILAEWLLLQALEANGLHPQGYSLVVSHACPGPDFVLGQTAYDVKAIPFRGGFLCINEQQRLNPAHAVDFILPAWFTRPTELHVMAPIPYSLVACWPLRYEHSPYRSISIEALKPLLSFSDLIGGRR